MRPEDRREPLDPHPLEAEACASCGGASASTLDRVWEATRLPGPSAATLDAMWNRAAIELDRIEADRSIPMTRRRRGGFAWLALAQAAVILIGIGIGLGRRGGEPSAGVPHLVNQTAKVAEPVVVGFDQTLVVRIDDDGHQVELLAEPLVSASLADNSSHDLFNWAESNANLR